MTKIYTNEEIKLLKKYYQECRNVQYVGEDGENMIVNCKTQLGALRKFRKQWKIDVGDTVDIDEYGVDAITVAYLYLGTEEERNNNPDSEWFIDRSDKNGTQFPVWYWSI